MNTNEQKPTAGTDGQTLVEFAQGETSGGKLSTLPRNFVRASTTRQILLTPGAVLAIPVAGTRFYIVDSNTSDYIGVKTDRTVEELFNAGCGKAFPDEQYFIGLEIRNTSLVNTVTIVLFAGFGDYIDRRLTVVDGRFNSVVPVREAPTLIQGQVATSIAALATLTLNTTPSGAVRRKAVIISNLDLANVLIIRDSSNHPCAAVFPLTSCTLPVSEEIRIYNGTASAIVCYISEIFYKST